MMNQKLYSLEFEEIMIKIIKTTWVQQNQLLTAHRLNCVDNRTCEMVQI